MSLPHTFPHKHMNDLTAKAELKFPSLVMSKTSRAVAFKDQGVAAWWVSSKGMHKGSPWAETRIRPDHDWHMGRKDSTLHGERKGGRREGKQRGNRHPMCT